MNTIKIDSTYEKVEITSHKDLRGGDVWVTFDATIGFPVVHITSKGQFNGLALPHTGEWPDGRQSYVNPELIDADHTRIQFNVYRKRRSFGKHPAFSGWIGNAGSTAKCINPSAPTLDRSYIQLYDTRLTWVAGVKLGTLARGKEQQFADAVASMMDAMEGAE
jgi:hypothetical protein